jgi:hypothetical protein
MVIITGVIRDGIRSTDDYIYYVSGATVGYGSVTTTSDNGVFQISSGVVDTILHVSKERYIPVDINMTFFGIRYDPNRLLSGSVLEVTPVSGDTSISTISIAGMDQLISGSYTSSMIYIANGLNSGQICYVISNTDRTFNVKF